MEKKDDGAYLAMSPVASAESLAIHCVNLSKELERLLAKPNGFDKKAMEAIAHFGDVWDVRIEAFLPKSMGGML